MRKGNVIKEFCRLSTEVGGYFNHKYPHDCFCVESRDYSKYSFQFDNNIINFIKEAAHEKMYKEKFKEVNKEMIKDRIHSLCKTIYYTEQYKGGRGKLLPLVEELYELLKGA